MIGSFLTRGLVMVFGYAYPAYECYKTVEMNRPDIEQLRFWCQYWILVAMLTVGERVGDAFISWVPMYSEAKLAFFIYLWWPKTKGTTYVYESFFRPIVAEHEPEIDRSLSELRTKAGDMAVLYWQKAFSYGQTRVFDVLQYVASQSNRPQPAKKQEQVRQPTAPPIHNKRATTTEEPITPVSISSSSSQGLEDDDDDVIEEVTSKGHVAASSSSAAVPNARKVNPAPPLTQTTKASTSSEAKAMEIEVEVAPSPGVTKENPQSNSPPQETMMEETVHFTRARARKTQSAPGR